MGLGDTNSYGYDEHALPVLLALADSYSPDYRVFTQTGVVVHFLTSKKKFEQARQLVASAESLRTSDARFSDLGIGVSEGELIGDFDFLGRVKAGGIGLIGDAIVEAVRGEKILGAYKEKLNSVAQSLHVQTA